MPSGRNLKCTIRSSEPHSLQFVAHPYVLETSTIASCCHHHILHNTHHTFHYRWRHDGQYLCTRKWACRSHVAIEWFMRSAYVGGLLHLFIHYTHYYNHPPHFPRGLTATIWIAWSKKPSRFCQLCNHAKK